MEFDIDGAKVAGSAKALLSDKDVYAVMSAFGDGCERWYKIDIRNSKGIMNPRILRYVSSFVKEFGVDDSVKVVEQLFSIRHQGKWLNETVGTAIFYKNHRWLAEKMLMESGRGKAVIPDPKW
jgi:hypothetical protein